MRPNGNGLIEMVDEKSKERGFFCMRLAGYILKEQKETGADLYDQRFAEAKAGVCAYRLNCDIYKRTREQHKGEAKQLTLHF